ncbi:MAG: hypothetical protein JNL32_16340 [Candidatus Kapabacteria bacterium]|nr:hypothetical protein [Candidatus Kapabacteria bacterium]
MDMISRYLTKLKNDQIMAEFYVDKYDETHYGILVDFSSDFIVIERYNNFSKYDGVVVLMRHNISRVRWSGNEIESIAMLADTSARDSAPKINLSSITTVMQSIHAQYNHITVHIQDMDNSVCFIGQIHEMDNETVIIHEFGTKVSLDRKYIMLSTDTITRVDANGEYENFVKQLFKR